MCVCLLCVSKQVLVSFPGASDELTGAVVMACGAEPAGSICAAFGAVGR